MKQHKKDTSFFNILVVVDFLTAKTSAVLEEVMSKHTSMRYRSGPSGLMTDPGFLMQSRMISGPPPYLQAFMNR